SEAGFRASVVMRDMQRAAVLVILGRFRHCNSCVVSGQWHPGRPQRRFRLTTDNCLLTTMLQLGWIDTLVIVAYLASAIVVGLLGSGKNKNLESFLLGDRNLPWWAILGSIVATETSGVTVLSVPGHGVGPVGMKFLQIALGYIVGRSLIVYFLL